MGHDESKLIVLYDDQCPLCTFQMKLITWLDWFHVTKLLPLSHPDAAAVASGIEREDLLEALHCIAPGGAIYRGARAIRHIAIRMPLSIPLALFLWIPGVIFVAERVYAWVSRNRHLLSRLFGCREACSILPGRKRQGEGTVQVAEPVEGESKTGG